MTRKGGYCTEIKSKGGKEIAVRSTKVIVDNPTEYLSTLNKASVLRSSAGNGHLLIETLMGPRSVVVLSKFGQDAPQMLSIEDEHMLQAFVPDSANLRPTHTLTLHYICRHNSPARFPLDHRCHCSMCPGRFSPVGSRHHTHRHSRHRSSSCRCRRTRIPRHPHH